VLQLRRTEWSPLVRKRRLTLGSLAHQLLARVLRGTPVGGTFARRPLPEEADTALRAELASLRERWPRDRYWDSFHAELGEMTRLLLGQVCRLPAGPYVAVEAKLPAGTAIPLAGTGETIGIIGRMDLVLSDRPDWGGAQVDVVDFKTGADARLSAAAMANVASLQLGIYLAAVQSLGTRGGRVWMLKPDQTKPTYITADELPLALAGLAQLGRHLATGRYGARTIDRTDFVSGYPWPIACAPIPQSVLERKFAATFGGAVAAGGGEAPDE
jgi:hypothetical protein